MADPDREDLLLLALELGAIAEALEDVPVTTPDLAYARERIEAMRGLVGEMLARLDRGS